MTKTIGKVQRTVELPPNEPAKIEDRIAFFRAEMARATPQEREQLEAIIADLQKAVA